MRIHRARETYIVLKDVDTGMQYKYTPYQYKGEWLETDAKAPPPGNYIREEWVTVTSFESAEIIHTTDSKGKS